MLYDKTDAYDLKQAEIKGYGIANQAQANGPTPAATADMIADQRIALLKESFRYHAPRPDQLPKYQNLRDAALAFATVIVRNTPEGRNSERAIELLEQVLMTANKSIALGY